MEPMPLSAELLLEPQKLQHNTGMPQGGWRNLRSPQPPSAPSTRPRQFFTVDKRDSPFKKQRWSGTPEQYCSQSDLVTPRGGDDPGDDPWGTGLVK